MLKLPPNAEELITSKNPAVTELKLINMGLTDDLIPSLIERINSNPYITTLNLRHNNLTGEAMLQLANQLENVDQIILRRNHGTSDEAIKALCLNSRLKKIDLSDCGLTNDHAKFIAEHSQQIEFDVSDNPNIETKYLRAIEAKMECNRNPVAQFWSKPDSSSDNTILNNSSPINESVISFS